MAETSTGALDFASFPRRMAALLFDWVACTFVAAMIIGPDTYFASDGAKGNSWSPLLVLLIFVVETGLGVALAGGSFGQLICRIRVLQLDGKPLSLLRSLFRSVLVALVVPPLIFKPEDGRGVHDIWNGSAAYRL